MIHKGDVTAEDGLSSAHALKSKPVADSFEDDDISPHISKRTSGAKRGTKRRGWSRNFDGFFHI